ncbi:MAG: DMT family transporter [Candidatus Hermodarchaeota archaeon]
MTESRFKNYLSLVIAAIGFGTIPVFAFHLTLLGVPSLQQAFFRILFTVFFLFIGLGITFAFRNILIRREHLVQFAIYGLIAIAMSIIVYVTAIAIGTPVVIAVSLTYLYPAITLILGRIFLQEALTSIRLIAVPLSIIGAIVVSFPLTPYIAEVPIAGIILALSNAVFAACYMILGRKWGSFEGYRPTITTFWGFFFAMLWTGPLMLILGFFITDPRVSGFQLFLPPYTWLLLLGFALISTAIPYTLTNVGVERIDAAAASIILLLDPISSVIFGVIFLSQPVAFLQAIGAALILFATALIALEPRLQQRRKSQNAL